MRGVSNESYLAVLSCTAVNVYHAIQGGPNLFICG